jgi:multicomponent Na+:H+ antiporter subunit D
MPEYLPPAVILIVAALLIGPTRGHVRSAIVLLAPLATLWAIWQVPDGVVLTVPFLDYQIEPVEGSDLRRLFATIFAIMAFCSPSVRHAGTSSPQRMPMRQARSA